MIYAGDNYSFTLFITRDVTTVVSISACVQSGGNTTYTYALKSGPALELETSIVVTGMAHSANNGTFVITNLGTNTFTVANSGSTQTETGTGTSGTIPNVTTPPVIQIIRISDFSAVLGSPANMTNLDSTKQLWKYAWNIGAAQSGEYVAIVSYAADGKTFSGKPIEKVHIGDTNIIGLLALDSTVAKDATVAKDSTVAKSSDLIAVNPDNSATVLSIKNKTDALPSDPAGMTLLATLISNVADLHDSALGSQTVDKTQNPALYTMKRLNNSILSQYHLTDDSSSTSRTKV